MRRTIEIIGSSFKMAMQELWKNKLRTFLSLFGITIGIFCIIGVLATVNSLEHNIQNEYVKRPEPKFDEIKQIKERTPSAKYVAFNINANDNVEYRDNSLSGVNLFGNSEDFQNIQPVDVAYGRFITESEFDHGSPVAIIGNEVAEKLFVSPDIAIGKLVQVRGKKLQIIGVIKKQGKSMIGGWQFDQSVIMPYKFARNIMWARNSSPVILVQGKDNLRSVALKDDLRGAMRAIHKLNPRVDDNFALNDINDFSEAVSNIFVPLNIGGWIIAGTLWYAKMDRMARAVELIYAKVFGNPMP